MGNSQFIKSFENRMCKTIEEYNLINKKDKVLVAVSGGKDSTTTLYLLKKFGFKVEGIIIDLLIGDWSKKNLENIKKFCKQNKIKLRIINVKKEFGLSMPRIRFVIQSKVKLNNCIICGIIKRWLLNKAARKLKANKIATGHNLDDEASTIIMNLFNNFEVGFGIGPKTGISSYKGFVQRIKPLFFSKESDIKKYSQVMKFPVLYEKCPCSVRAFRRGIKHELDELEKQNPKIKYNIVKNFLRLKQKLLKKHKIENKLNYCKICGEPSRKNVCKTCQLIQHIKVKK